MPINYQFTLALKALREVQAELGDEAAAKEVAFPTLDEVLEQVTSLPQDSLLFGIASDGLPLMLNLQDPSPGPLLIVGDRGSGKTLFLQVLAQAASRLQQAEHLQLAVLSDSPGEWRNIDPSEHLLGIWAAYEAKANELLDDLAAWTQAGGDGRNVLLLLDGLDAVLHMDPAAEETLGYLLREGPRCHLWPLVTVNAARAVRLPAWLSYFRTRIYGRIAHPSLADELTPVPGAGLNTLFPAAQFCLREHTNWLRFWLPSLT